MDFSKIFSILNDENIDKNEVFRLVDVIKNADLEDESTLRSIIKQASIVAKRPIDRETEDKIVKRVQKEG